MSRIPSLSSPFLLGFEEIERALDRVAKTRRVKRRLPIYSTEFGIQTDPPDCVGFGAPIARQAGILNEAEYDSYVSRRVKTYSQYLLIDDLLQYSHRPYPAACQWKQHRRVPICRLITFVLVFPHPCDSLEQALLEQTGCFRVAHHVCRSVDNCTPVTDNSREACSSSLMA